MLHSNSTSARVERANINSKADGHLLEEKTRDGAAGKGEQRQRATAGRAFILKSRPVEMHLPAATRKAPSMSVSHNEVRHGRGWIHSAGG